MLKIHSISSCQGVKVPSRFWTKLVETSAYILNRDNKTFLLINSYSAYIVEILSDIELVPIYRLPGHLYSKLCD